MVKKPKFFLIGVIGFLICVISANIFAQEQITITTYYPSPYGSYRELQWGTFPKGSQPKGVLSPNQGSSIELGGSGTPYIDFANDQDTDYDMRIILTGNDELRIDGGNFRITGNLTVDGSVNTCVRMTFTAASGYQECPVGYNIPMAPLTPASTSGIFLCCKYQ